MTPPREIEIDIDLIDVGERLREVDQERAEQLAHSMRERGLITPIEVREAEGGRYLLTVGAHRFFAARILAWTTLRAVLVNCTDDEARLREIDENLFRHELSPFDEANFLAERREIWERIHGDVRRGGDRRSKGQIVPLIQAIKMKGFVASTSEKFGLSSKAVKRALTRKAHIGTGVWDRIRGTEAAKNGAMLDKLRKLPLEAQEDVLRVMDERGCAIGEAVRIATAVPAPDPSTTRFDAAVRAYLKLTAAQREQFIKAVRSIKDEKTT